MLYCNSTKSAKKLQLGYPRLCKSSFNLLIGNSSSESFLRRYHFSKCIHRGTTALHSLVDTASSLGQYGRRNSLIEWRLISQHKHVDTTHNPHCTIRLHALEDKQNSLLLDVGHN